MEGLLKQPRMAMNLQLGDLTAVVKFAGASQPSLLLLDGQTQTYAPTSGAVKGIKSFTRISTGLYEVTLTEKVPRFMGVPQWSFLSATGISVVDKIGVVNPSGDLHTNTAGATSDVSVFRLQFTQKGAAVGALTAAAQTATVTGNSNGAGAAGTTNLGGIVTGTPTFAAVVALPTVANSTSAVTGSITLSDSAVDPASGDIAYIYFAFQQNIANEG